MMKYSIAILCLILSNFLTAQIKPNFFPEDITATGVEQMCFCKPGVSNKSKSRGLELSYTWFAGSDYIAAIDEQTRLSNFDKFQNFKFSIKVPVIYRGNTTLIVGYKFLSDYYDFDRIGDKFSEAFQAMDVNALKSNVFDVIVTHSLNETRYMAARLGYAANGNYSDWIKFDWLNFDKSYSIYKFLGLYAIKPNENFEWGFGITGSVSFRRSSFVPFLVYNRTYNDRWGIESIFPGYVFARYNLSLSDILLAGVEYSSRSYRLEIDRPMRENLDYALNQSAIVLTTQLDHQFSSWVWATIKVGYRFNLDSEFLGKNDLTPSFDADISDAPFIQMGVFITPPDNVKNRMQGGR